MRQLLRYSRPRGFSLLELLIVVAMLGILATLGLPKFRLVRETNNLQGARQRVESMVATARATAIHKGRLSRFAVSGNWVSVWSQNPTTGIWEPQVNWLDISSVFPGVQIQVAGAAVNNVYYEPRGLTWSNTKPPSTMVFRLVGQTKKDSVCVTRQGQILPRGCSL